MKDELPYEELIAGKLADIPLPDEDMAWEDMRRRLEEDKDRRFIPFWLNGCLGWGLTGIVAIGLAWWMLKPAQWFHSRRQTDNISIESNKEKVHHLDQADSAIMTNSSEPDQKADSLERTVLTGYPDLKGESAIDNEKSGTGIQNQGDKQPDNSANASDRTKKKKKTSLPGGDEKKDDSENITITQKTGKRKNGSVPIAKAPKQKPVQPKQTDEPSDNEKDNKNDKNDSLIIAKPVANSNDSVTNSSKPVDLADSLIMKKKDSVLTARTRPDTTVKRQKEDSSKKKSFSVSAGTGIYQQLPIAGQSMVPYNAWGRKGTFMDYIPSVIIRVNREEKWFFQSEFRYGAPQYTKKVLFGQRTDTNYITRKVEINSTRLRKTYYHQVPLTFNYYVAPGLAIGVGMTWNRFSSAISENEIVMRDLGTGLDTVFSPARIFRVRRPDSNFVKTFWQAVFELSYQKKKFSAGLRYSFGLQPFIRFDLPDLPNQSMKNSALQFFIRYELWRSKAKSAKENSR